MDTLAHSEPGTHIIWISMIKENMIQQGIFAPSSRFACKICQNASGQYANAAASLCDICNTLNRNQFVNHGRDDFVIMHVRGHRCSSIACVSKPLCHTINQDISDSWRGRVWGYQIMSEMHNMWTVEAWSCIRRENITPCQLCCRRAIAHAFHRNVCPARRRVDNLQG